MALNVLIPPLGPDDEMVFVPADPWRGGLVGVWRRDGAVAGARAKEQLTLRLVLPAGRSVRRADVAGHGIPLATAIPVLATLPAEAAVSASARAWATATQVAVGLVARGRLLPARTQLGFDAWRVGPLDPADHALVTELAEAMPPQAHALEVPGASPARIRSARSLLVEFIDAVADTLVRSAAAAPRECQRAFSTEAAVEVTDLDEWLEAVGGGPTDRATPGLRLTLPEGADGEFRALVQLRSALDPSLVVDAGELWSAPGPVLARLGQDADASLLLSLRRGARAWPPLGRLLDEVAPTELALDDDEVEDLLGPGADALRAAGMEVLWPAELAGGFSVRAIVSTPTPASVSTPQFNVEQLLEFRWEVAMGGQPLSAEELDALAEAKRPLVRLRGRWVLADPELAARLRRSPRRRLSGGELLAAALTGTIEVDGQQVTVEVQSSIGALADRLRGLDHVGELPEPEGLTATLRPYQRRGLAWLAEMAGLGVGGCLADDMGLGKTVQVIALHLHRQTEPSTAGPSLVACPASLLGNWERELARFAPGVPVRRYHGGERHLAEVAENEVVLVTYGVVRRDRAQLSTVPWGLVVADEVQHAKNPLSRTAKELRGVPGLARIALTGTPVENRLTDLWSILDWTTPGLLGPLDPFRRTVAVPIERQRDPVATDRLAALVRPFLLRRRKTDPEIAPDLPPKTTTDVVVPLTSEQATLYEAVVRDAMDRIRGTAGIERRGLVLQLLTGLKQICNHPAQYLKQAGPITARSGKFTALDELLEVILDEGDSVLVFTQYVQMARIIERHLAGAGIASLFLHGSLPPVRRDELVTRFQTGQCRVFLLSLRAGGTGLNLTAATHVVHYDRWWNPAVEDQASDRAWRIGQERPVQVHRLITEGTLEDRIAALLESKRELAEAVVGGGEGWLTELGDDDLAAMVELGPTR